MCDACSKYIQPTYNNKANHYCIINQQDILFHKPCFPLTFQSVSPHIFLKAYSTSLKTLLQHRILYILYTGNNYIYYFEHFHPIALVLELGELLLCTDGSTSPNYLSSHK